jgi:hypothetical protein
LSDPAHSMPNDYIGEEGTGRIEQWTIPRGHPPLNAPAFPQCVIDARKLCRIAAGSRNSQ